MRRYWVPEEYCDDRHVLLKDDVFHHIVVVCRQDVGSRFEVIFKNKAHLVEIQSIEKKQAVAIIIESRDLPSLPKPELHLALSLPKYQTMDRVVEKMVELGVSAIHLFHSDFSFKKANAGELNKKMQRWRKIIQGATQQTGRGQLMSLTDITPLGVLLAENLPREGRFGLLAYEGEGEKINQAQLSALPGQVDEIWIFVGSEGGFSSADLELFKDYKLLPISLGDQVLRVETACVTLMSILKYELGHFD